MSLVPTYRPERQTLESFSFWDAGCMLAAAMLICYACSEKIDSDWSILYKSNTQHTDLTPSMRHTCCCDVTCHITSWKHVPCYNMFQGWWGVSLLSMLDSTLAISGRACVIVTCIFIPCTYHTRLILIRLHLKRMYPYALFMNLHFCVVITFIYCWYRYSCTLCKNRSFVKTGYKWKTASGDAVL